ncbi:hypothetical protein IVY21_00585 [Salmonella enterica subsp. enterica serovar Worthington]|nr:hypothetical protein [Salmonella enterica subsp. enterica serovar Worthington]
MELKATSLGKRLAQHPYDRAEILNAGVKVSGDRHEYLIPFNQLLAIHCKRGLVWGELEFVLPEDKVVRLHGTEWSETQQFHRYLDAHWRRWSQEMSDVAAQALQEQWARISERTGENQWLTRERVRGWNTKFARRLPPYRCRSHVWRSLLTVARYGVSVWHGYRIAREVGSSIIRRMLMPCWKRMPTFYADRILSA